MIKKLSKSSFLNSQNDTASQATPMAVGAEKAVQPTILERYYTKKEKKDTRPRNNDVDFNKVKI